MTGWKAILVSLILALPLVGVFAIGIRLILKKRKAGLKPRAVLKAVACLTIPMAVALFVIPGIMGLLGLMNLNAPDVQLIQIGNRTTSDSEDIRKIVTALNEVAWFVPYRGGWPQETELRITYANGSQEEYLIGYYKPLEGVVIRKRNDWWLVKSKAECGYSKSLEQVIRTMGVLLPGQKQ